MRPLILGQDNLADSCNILSEVAELICDLGSGITGDILGIISGCYSSAKSSVKNENPGFLEKPGL